MKHWYLSPLAITAKNKIQKFKRDIPDAIKRDIRDAIKRAGFAGFTGYKK
jgi:hypothetical protein